MKFCHRIPERTFKFKKWYFPICSRCTGIYMGYFSLLLLDISIPINASYYLVFIGLTLVIPTFLDGYTQYCGLRMSNNNLRFFTGFIAGLGSFIIMIFIIKNLSCLLNIN